jgi:HK97 family phage prohead protease
MLARKNDGAAVTTKHFDSAFQLKALEDDGTFSGYGAVFGNVDKVMDVIKKGAFKRTLREHKAAGSRPKLLWQHDTRQPIGAFDAVKEDDTGLYVEGRLALKTRQGGEAYELLKMEAINGLSIGYWPVEWKWDDKEGVRTLLDVDLFEISLVTFPANPAAAVAAVKASNRCKTVRDFEAFLRDEGGFSLAASKAIASNGFKANPTPRDEDGGHSDLLAAVQRASAALTS